MKINWLEALDTPIEDIEQWVGIDKDCTKWDMCAVGSLPDEIPRKTNSFEPKDRMLRKHGMDFSMHVINASLAMKNYHVSNNLSWKYSFYSYTQQARYKLQTINNRAKTLLERMNLDVKTIYPDDPKAYHRYCDGNGNITNHYDKLDNKI